MEGCSTPLCNDFIYPRDRLRCYQCDDCNSLTIEPQYCRLYFAFHAACVVYLNPTTNAVHRGCQTDVEDSYCDEGNTHCVYCMYNNCNRDLSHRESSFACYTCLEEDLPCTSVDKHTKIVPYAYIVELGRGVYCWTIHAGVNSTVVYRMHDMEPRLEYYLGKFCGGDVNYQCERCMGNLCNVNEGYGVCYECREDQTGCNMFGSDLVPVACAAHYANHYGCYSFAVDRPVNLTSGIRRGCINDLDFLHRQSCSSTPYCFYCESDFCNQGTNICWSCDEVIGLNETSTTCLGNDTNTAERPWATALCGTGDSCFLRVRSFELQTVVSRGCLTQRLLNEEFLRDPGSFEICQFSFCNDWGGLGLVHMCFGANDTILECGSRSGYCYVVTYMTARGEQEFEKGCYDPNKKFNLYQLLCDNHIQSCRICGGDLCNDDPLEAPMRKFCHICNDRKNCAFYDNARQPAPCQGLKQFHDEETCFYGFNPATGNVTRGCTLEVYPGRKTPPDYFYYCNVDGCNWPAVNIFQCYQCDSNQYDSPDGYCNKILGQRNRELIKSRACEGGEYFTYSDRGCYTYMTPLGVVKRGCIRHLPAEVLHYCHKNQTHCRLCFYEKCNSLDAKAGFLLWQLMRVFLVGSLLIHFVL